MSMRVLMVVEYEGQTVRIERVAGESRAMCEARPANLVSEIDATVKQVRDALGIEATP